MFYRCEDVSAAAGGEGGFRQNLKVVDIEVIKHICVQLSWFAIAYGLASLEQKWLPELEVSNGEVITEIMLTYKCLERQHDI